MELQPAPIETAVRLIRDIEDSHFYGSLELKFENGKLVLIRKTESINIRKANENTHLNHRENRENNERFKS